MSTAIQTELFPITPTTKKGSIQEMFEEFDELNPHVYEALKELALKAKRSGAKKLGIKALYEILRWNYMLQTGGAEYKLPNDFHSRYARKLMENEPELANMFNTRRLRSE